MEWTLHSKSRTFVLLVVISCVLLAGCSGLVGDDSPSEDNGTNDTNGTEEVNNTTTDPEEANDTTTAPTESNNTTDAEQADPPNSEDSGELNESNSTSENDTGTTETDETNDTTGTDETDDTTGTEGTEEYASPTDLRIEGVTHMESDANLDRDQVTVTNTNDDLARPIGGWEIVFEGTDQRVTIEEGTVIEPGETQTIPLGDGEKVLSEDGGVAHVYDADGNHVGSWDYIGSPSSPPEASGEDEVGYIQFEITDAESGEGIEDADVTLEGGETPLTGSTDGAGVTTVREIPYGEYELTVEHDEYASHSEMITVDEEGAERTIELDSSESTEASSQSMTTRTLLTVSG